MGSVNVKEMAEVLDDDFPATPAMEKRTLDTAFDPRSPTAEITRTPIHVERTPKLLFDPRSPTVGIDRTPIHIVRQRDIRPASTDSPSIVKVDEILDPRSPTAGVERTPLYVRAKETKTSAEGMDTVDALLDPRSPTYGIARTPLYVKAQEVVDKFDLSLAEETQEETKTPVTYKAIHDPRSPATGFERTPVIVKPLEKELEAAALELVLPEEQKPEEDEGALLATVQAESKEEESKDIASPATPTTATESVRRRKPSKQLFKADTETTPIQRSPFKVLNENDTQNSPSKVTEMKSRSPGPRSPLKVIDNSPRSAATTLAGKRKVDVNSPRAIVQRKQTTKLTSKLGCTLQATQGQQRSPGRSSRGSENGFMIFQDDKENN